MTHVAYNYKCFRLLITLITLIFVRHCFPSYLGFFSYYFKFKFFDDFRSKYDILVKNKVDVFIYTLLLLLFHIALVHQISIQTGK